MHQKRYFVSHRTGLQCLNTINRYATFNYLYYYSYFAYVNTQSNFHLQNGMSSFSNYLHAMLFSWFFAPLICVVLQYCAALAS